MHPRSDGWAETGHSSCMKRRCMIFHILHFPFDTANGLDGYLKAIRNTNKCNEVERTEFFFLSMDVSFFGLSLDLCAPVRGTYKQKTPEKQSGGFFALFLTAGFFFFYITPLRSIVLCVYSALLPPSDCHLFLFPTPSRSGLRGLSSLCRVII